MVTWPPCALAGAPLTTRGRRGGVRRGDVVVVDSWRSVLTVPCLARPPLLCILLVVRRGDVASCALAGAPLVAVVVLR